LAVVVVLVAAATDVTLYTAAVVTVKAMAVGSAIVSVAVVRLLWLGGLVGLS